MFFSVPLSTKRLSQRCEEINGNIKLDRGFVTLIRVKIHLFTYNNQTCK